MIVIRKDLKMRKGKMCAQAAHASMKVVVDELFRIEFNKNFTKFEMTLRHDNPMYLWLEGRFTKVVVGCDSKGELYDLAELAAIKKLPFAIIEDAGLTEFHGKKTITALAIGPADSEVIDTITGNLKLL